MRVSKSIAITLASAGTLASAQHKHLHHHENKRDAVATETIIAPGPVVTDFILDHQTIPVSQVCAGLADGSLQFDSGVTFPGLCDQFVQSSTAAPSSSAVPSSAAQFYQEAIATSVASSSSASSAVVIPSSSSSSVSSSSISPSSVPTSSSSSNASSDSGSGSVDLDFPDGELDCSTFPSSHGAVALDYLGLNGWAGLQSVTYSGSAISNIVTGVSGGCQEGMMCSYACPAGYQKGQWPNTQGATGQSVGGVQCKGGKLYKTHDTNTQLCISGTGNVKGQNKMSDGVAICRTDYPGKAKLLPRF